MSKQEEVEQLEKLFMMFGVSLGTFGNIVGEQEFKNEATKLVAWQISNKLERLYIEIENDIDFLKNTSSNKH